MHVKTFCNQQREVAGTRVWGTHELAGPVLDEVGDAVEAKVQDDCMWRSRGRDGVRRVSSEQNCAASASMQVRIEHPLQQKGEGVRRKIHWIAALNPSPSCGAAVEELEVEVELEVDVEVEVEVEVEV